MRRDVRRAFAVLCALVLSGQSCSIAPMENGTGAAEDERGQALGGSKQPLAARCTEVHDPSSAVQVEREPDMTSMVEPVYPEEAKQAKEQGVVLCHAYVDATGRVTKAHIFQHVTPTLDQAALNAVNTALFLPAYGKSGAVGTWVVVPVEFMLH